MSHNEIILEEFSAEERGLIESARIVLDLSLSTFYKDAIVSYARQIVQIERKIKRFTSHAPTEAGLPQRYTIEDFAEARGVSRAYAYKLVRSGDCPTFFKIGRHVFFLREDWDYWFGKITKGES